METIDAKKLLGGSSYLLMGQAGLSFAVTTRNTALLSAGDAPLLVTVLAPLAYAGTYPLDPAALASGPVFLRPPELAGQPVVDAPLEVRPALWAYDGAAMEPPRAWQWQSDGVDIPGATGTVFTPQPDHAGTLLRVVETVTGAGGAATVASASATVGS